jgi:CHASE3 domain sensor protein
LGLSAPINIKLGFGIGCLLFLSLAVGVVLRNSSWTQNDLSIARNNEVIERLDGLDSSFNRIENLARRFTDGGNIADLERVRVSLRNAANGEREIERLTAGNPLQKVNVVDLRDAINRIADTLGPPSHARGSRCTGQ